MRHATRHRLPSQANRRAATLVELIMAVAIAGLIAAGMQSAIFVAMRSIPNSQGSAQTTIQGSQIMDRLVTELENAVYITERSATTLGFTVPDRNGDGIPERLRYAWTGVPGGALTFQYNGGQPITIASSVNQFSFTPKTQAVGETYPGTNTEDATESLLLDYSSNTATNSAVTSTQWFGQYLTVTLSGTATAWRPTRLQVYVRRFSVPATTLVQLRPVSAGLTPTTTVSDQGSISSSVMTPSYAWQSISYTQVAPLASGASICCVLLPQSGSSTMYTTNSNVAAGLLTTTNSGSSWTYDSGKALVCQLYGKLLRSTASQTTNSNYLLSMAVSLQLAASAPVLQTTAAALNHPELLSGLWELKFDSNPTTLDVNGDGVSDWSVVGGGNFDTTTISGGQWTTSGTSLQTSPGSDFAKTTIVDLRMQNTTVGGQGATFAINSSRSGSSCAPVFVRLALQSDGTQTLTLLKGVSDSSTQSLIAIPSLSSQAVDVHFVIDPTGPTVFLTVNGVQRGSFSLTRFTSSDSGRTATIGAQGSQAKFSYARVRVLE